MSAIFKGNTLSAAQWTAGATAAGIVAGADPGFYLYAFGAPSFVSRDTFMSQLAGTYPSAPPSGTQTPVTSITIIDGIITVIS